MVERDGFERIMASLYDAMLDDARWSATAALINEVCGVQGNALAVGEGPADDIRLSFVGLYDRGGRREDLEREYVENYYPTDERVPRLLQRPFGRMLHMRTDQYAAHELRRSRAYREFHVQTNNGNSLAVTMDGLDGSYVSWSINDPVASDGWGAPQIAMVTRLVPHIRQFGLVRQALVRAEAHRTTNAQLLANPRIGVVHLDQRGRILSANDRALRVLQGAHGLTDRDGVLRARLPGEERRLQRLLGAALPTGGAVAVGGSMALRRAPLLPPFVVYVKPVSAPQPDYGVRHVAALVLIVEPGCGPRVDRDAVASTLGLTPAENRVAIGLAEGRSVGQMAEAAACTRGAIYWHLKQIYQKLSISRQADLVRMVLSISEFG